MLWEPMSPCQKITPWFCVNAFIRIKNPPLKILKINLYVSEYFQQTWYGSMSRPVVMQQNENYFITALPKTATVISVMNRIRLCFHMMKLIENMLFVLCHVFLHTIFAKDKYGHLMIHDVFFFFILSILGTLSLHWKPHRKLISCRIRVLLL